PPKNLKALRSLQGMLAYIRCFIANLSGKCQPFQHLMKKDVPFKWDTKCQNVLDNIKQYLLNPPVLTAPIQGRPMILYTAVTETSLGALLAQQNDDAKEQALYYLSNTLLHPEMNYSPTDKYCLTLTFVPKKLRHYLLSLSSRSKVIIELLGGPSNS
ncbi:ribonuclease H family protein, partial [Serratia marcescens]|nr:hypothetical protein [Serratia marcescens]